MLTTGTDACSASSSTSSCGPVRTPTACTIRDSTSAMSREGLAARHLQLALAQHQRVAAQLGTPTSNETRVRVEGLSKTSATLRPSSAATRAGRAFSSIARSSSRAELVGRKLLAGQEVP